MDHHQVLCQRCSDVAIHSNLMVLLSFSYDPFIILIKYMHSYLFHFFPFDHAFLFFKTNSCDIQYLGHHHSCSSKIMTSFTINRVRKKGLSLKAHTYIYSFVNLYCIYTPRNNFIVYHKAICRRTWSLSLTSVIMQIMCHMLHA